MAIGLDGELISTRDPKTIKTFFDYEPILEEKMELDIVYGFHRDRNPDNGWGEYRWTLMNAQCGLRETELTSELKRILIEDIIEHYKGVPGYEKLKEFDLIK